MIHGQMTTRQTITLHDTVYETTHTKKYAHRKPFAPKDPKRVAAIIPGLILNLFVKPGQRVRRGDGLLVLEAMKMQNHIAAHDGGIVKALRVSPGDTVTKGQLLIEFE